MERDGISKLWRRWGKDKLLRLLLWVGLAGMVLIALSELLPSRDRTQSNVSVTLTASQVEQALEQRVTALLRQVEGVGSCRVMVTLESDARAVYAADTVSSAQADGATAFSESYLTVDTDVGPVGLLLTRIQPTVKGVAVVCDGGDSDAVRQQVIQVVSTAFHISERRVCVVKQK